MAENNSQWREKYYDSIEKLENKCKEWQELEDLFKQAISRLSIVAEGQSEKLDEVLDQLRIEIRKNKDTQIIHSILDNLSAEIIKLDNQTKSTVSGDAGFLLKLIKQMELSGKAEKKSRKLLKKLNAKKSPTQEELIESFKDVLSEVVAQAISEAQKNTGSQKGGFLKQLFSNDKIPQSSETLQDSDKSLAKQTEVKDKQTHLEKSNGHQDILIRLIESLPLEAEVNDKAEKLKNEFAHGITTAQLPEALKSIAGLVSTMRNKVQQEYKEFELFLHKLEERLKEVHEHLSKDVQEQQSSYQSGIELDNTVKQQVINISGSISVYSNIGDMEKTVQHHLDIIVKHIDLHRLKENERISRVEVQNKELLDKLTALELESSSLREKVIATQNKALIDPLTQIPNRLAYEQRLQQEFARWRRYQSSLLIMVWDIDYFKKVNDKYGHQAGDKVLKIVAKLLHENIRETDFVGRFGGEEFVGLIPETTQDGGFKIAEKIRTSIEKLEFHYQGNLVKVSISCGISMFMKNDSVENAFARADKALYQAKDQGRNRCVIA